MAIKSGPVEVGKYNDQHCWNCGKMKFAPYTDDGNNDLICWGCHAVNTTADPTPYPKPIVMPPLPQKRKKGGVFSFINEVDKIVGRF